MIRPQAPEGPSKATMSRPVAAPVASLSCMLPTPWMRHSRLTGAVLVLGIMKGRY